MNDRGEPIPVDAPTAQPYDKPRMIAPDADKAATARFRGKVSAWAARIDAARAVTRKAEK